MFSFFLIVVLKFDDQLTTGMLLVWRIKQMTGKNVKLFDTLDPDPELDNKILGKSCKRLIMTFGFELAQVWILDLGFIFF